jgi:competence protein ComEC
MGQGLQAQDWPSLGPSDGGVFARAASAFSDMLVAQRDRWALWLPVALGIGIGLYFALRSEPGHWIGALVLALCTGLAWAGRRRTALLLPALCAVALACGFTAAQLSALRAEAPVVARQLGPLRVEGRVAEVEATQRGQRVLLEQVSLANGQPAPPRVRLSMTARTAPLLPGERIAVSAILRPPPEPALPGGFDFARQAWFDGLGAVGFSVGQAEVLPEREAPGAVDAARLSLAAARRQLTERVTAVIPGDAGAVAAALLTGERGGLSQAVWDTYRDSGLAHLLSISGLHMSMLAGLVFLVVRGALALVPAVALRFPIKKWTALVALAATFGYLLLSGAPVPTQRAFAMISIVLLAVLVDRTAISMRTVAWAAAAVLLWQPQALVGASFQMSFAAVIALIAAFEGLAPRMAVWRGEGGWLRGGILYVGGIVATTLIAGAATAFYAAHHFSRFASWSVAANLAAVPLTGFIVMPFGLLGLLLMPFGLEEWPLRIAGFGVELVNRTAVAVAAWPGAAVAVPSPPMTALALFSLGGLWLCLWQGRLRLPGLVAMLAAVGLTALERPPDVLVDDRAELMAVRGADGGLLLSADRGNRLVREAWLERAGGAAPARPFAAAAEQDGLRCDTLGCLYRRAGQVVALARRPEALLEDCAVAGVAISAAPLRHPCPSAQKVIDRFTVWRGGAHAVWLEEGAARIESVRAAQGRRPWVRWPDQERGDDDDAPEDAD